MIYDGEYTLTNPITGQHRTFKIRTVQNGNLKGRRVISLLTGPDNTSDYEGFAFLSDDSEAFSVWRRFQGTAYELYAKTLLNHLTGRDNRCVVQESRRCFKCGRLLTHPDSISLGIGPECASK